MSRDRSPVPRVLREGPGEKISFRRKRVEQDVFVAFVCQLIDTEGHRLTLQVARDNYLRLFDASRKNMRAWEKAHSEKIE